MGGQGPQDACRSKCSSQTPLMGADCTPLIQRTHREAASRGQQISPTGQPLHVGLPLAHSHKALGRPSRDSEGHEAWNTNQLALHRETVAPALVEHMAWKEAARQGRWRQCGEGPDGPRTRSRAPSS